MKIFVEIDLYELNDDGEREEMALTPGDLDNIRCELEEAVSKAGYTMTDSFFIDEADAELMCSELDAASERREKGKLNEGFE